MVGTFSVDGNLSMADLAATLTRNEQDFARLTALGIDPKSEKAQNSATFENADDQLGPLAVVARGATSSGDKIMSPNVYVAGAKTDIDIYRLPLA